MRIPSASVLRTRAELLCARRRGQARHELTPPEKARAGVTATDTARMVDEPPAGAYPGGFLLPRGNPGQRRHWQPGCSFTTRKHIDGVALPGAASRCRPTAARPMHGSRRSVHAPKISAQDRAAAPRGPRVADGVAHRASGMDEPEIRHDNRQGKNLWIPWMRVAGVTVSTLVLRGLLIILRETDRGTGFRRSRRKPHVIASYCEGLQRRDEKSWPRDGRVRIVRSPLQPNGTGSSPVRPTSHCTMNRDLSSRPWDVAQREDAAGLDPACCEFDSHHPYHYLRAPGPTPDTCTESSTSVRVTVARSPDDPLARAALHPRVPHRTVLMTAVDIAQRVEQSTHNRSGGGSIPPIQPLVTAFQA